MFRLQVQTAVLTPIAPHWAEHVWGDLLQRPGLAVTAGWPAHSPPDAALQRARCVALFSCQSGRLRQV